MILQATLQIVTKTVKKNLRSQTVTIPKGTQFFATQIKLLPPLRKTGLFLATKTTTIITFSAWGHHESPGLGNKY